MLLPARALRNGAAQSLPSKKFADIIYSDGNILTGAELLTSHPQHVSALTVGHGMILATGADPQILHAWKGPHTRVVDLHGAFVLPGINDAHVHLVAAGEQKLAVDPKGIVSLNAMLANTHHAILGARVLQTVVAGQPVACHATQSDRNSQ